MDHIQRLHYRCYEDAGRVVTLKRLVYTQQDRENIVAVFVKMINDLENNDDFSEIIKSQEVLIVWKSFFWRWYAWWRCSFLISFIINFRICLRYLILRWWRSMVLCRLFQNARAGHWALMSRICTTFFLFCFFFFLFFWNFNGILCFLAVAMMLAYAVVHMHDNSVFHS